jgi:hypothetical protein
MGCKRYADAIGFLSQRLKNMEFPVPNSSFFDIDQQGWRLSPWQWSCMFADGACFFIPIPMKVLV